ncbi:site-specific integrase [Metabacillus sediminilitoris]|uniref:Site-specific integrase n=2 Tax=Metabacillus sediminilitoris TaxID=2567941 RepID=A0A4V3WDW8_9BACI|nr:tyrosine-type recombinase/integrase [Metabacillus sediminilitoris]THF73896.1 site-specific integrase [Metabacillus sediminilitoris]
MRMGEVLGLRWSDIDLDTKIITIRQTLAKIDESGKYGLVTETKTHSSFRQIYLQVSLCQNLMNHRKVIENERKILNSKYMNNDLVVCTSSGNWVYPNNYRKGFKVTCEYLVLPKIRVHDLRHTHATFLIGGLQVNPKIVQERLGHANIKTTLGTYSHVLPSMQIEVAEKIDQAFK